jgi:hypothetical protein
MQAAYAGRKAQPAAVDEGQNQLKERNAVRNDQTPTRKGKRHPLAPVMLGIIVRIPR